MLITNIYIYSADVILTTWGARVEKHGDSIEEMGRRREMVYGEDGRADDSGKRDSSVVGSVYSV